MVGGTANRSAKSSKGIPGTVWASVRPAVTPALLEDIAQRITGRFNPECILLFGSYVWGKPDLDSDVELLVIMDSDEPLFPRIRRVREAARVVGLPMDIIVRTPTEVQERLSMGDSFLAEILEKGVVLYERGGRVGPKGRSRLPVGDRPESSTP